MVEALCLLLLTSCLNAAQEADSAATADAGEKAQIERPVAAIDPHPEVAVSER